LIHKKPDKKQEARPLTLNSWVDVEPDLRTGRLVRVLPGWRSDPAPVCALFPSSRQLPNRVRLFIDAMAVDVPWS
jgi:LysR family transcriptional activator of dmlA